MEITEIKQRLTIKQILQHYNLKPDKQNRLNCPFHNDKTPSMQIYYKTQTCYCFSSNCKTNGKGMDVIDFIMYKENIDKHNALLKATELINGCKVNGAKSTIISNSKDLAPCAVHPAPFTIERTQFLTNIFIYFKNAVHSSPGAKEYLQSRNLDFKQIEVGYNGGQFHHGTRRNDTLINQCVEYGLLIDKNLISRTGEKGYKVFGKYCIAFALRNKEDQITSLYFRSTINEDTQKHYYLKDRTGLYPHYPSPDTKTLLLTEAIIDAATLLQQLTLHPLPFTLSLLACYGTNGLTEEHLTAIKELKQLEELIFFFDGDQAGTKAIAKYAAMLKEQFPNLKITQVETPQGEDINSLLQGHDPEILTHLINQRIECIFSIENKEETINTPLLFSTEIPIEKKDLAPSNDPAPLTVDRSPSLDTTNPNNIHFNGIGANYTIKGGIKPQLDSLKVSLQIINKVTKQDYRSKIDLYDYKQLQSTADTVAEIIHLRKDQIERDLQLLAHLLEAYREEQQSNEPQRSRNRIIIKVPESTAAQCINFLKQPNLLQNFNELIGKAGVVGEENNRIFLFVIATSYKMKETLHALIQGSSGSGKTWLLKVISNLMPPEDTKRFTRVTENSFYNYGEYDLVNLFLCFEDIDGLEEKALLALRELQSNDILVSSTSQKQENGHIQSGERIVRGPIASIACTTKGEYYEDNISRCFVIAVDESREQTKRIINYQNNKSAGEIDPTQEREITEFIQHCMRLLKPYNVINPYANKIELPEDAHKIRRLNEMYQSIVRQITIINQYQRKQDKQGRLITQKEDLQAACEILFESIVLKVDELDGSLRQFYENLKKYIDKRGKEYEFNRFEVRTATGISKTQQHRYMQQLLNLEYLKQYGFANKGFKYKIAHWDNMQTVRAKIKDSLNNQLQNI